MSSGQSAWPSPRGERALGLYKRINDAYGPAMQRHGLFVGLSFSVIQIAIYAAGSAILGRRLTVLEFIVPMLLAGALIVIPFRRRLLSRISGAGPAIVAALSEDGLCPTCLYHLGGLTPEGDGCLVCPECASAWRADRVKNPEAFHEHFEGMDGARLMLRHLDGTILVSNFQDDRARPSPLVHPWMWGAIKSAATPELKARIKHARRRVLLNRLWLRLPVAMFFALTAAAVAVIVTWFGPPGMLRNFIGFGVAMSVVFTFALGVWVIFGRFGYSRARVAATMLTHHLCPSCASDLTDAAPESDGCTVCPNCSRAWRVLQSLPVR